MGQTLQNCGIGESEEDKKAREEEEKRAAKEKAAREKAAEEKFQRSEKLESDIIARVEAAENKITKNYGGSGVYCGQMEGGKRLGYGTYTDASGNTYVGEFKNGKKDGNGTCTFADGNKYVGQYKDGKRHGQGTFTFASGTIKHSGEWVNNMSKK
jgi:hypothetical protein